jgi:hypothetical protein
MALLRLCFGTSAEAGSARSRTAVLVALGSLLGLLVLAGSASAADPFANLRVGANFYPCPEQTDFTRPPLVGECLDDQGNRPEPVVTADCDPTGTSTITVTLSGVATGRYDGGVSETITVTIGPQTRPAQPAFQPFPDDGAQTGSVGFPTGELLSMEASYVISSSDGITETEIQGTAEAVPNDGNYGVCREFNDGDTDNPVFGDAPLTGFFYIVNAGVMSYDQWVVDSSGALFETGLAEAYLSNSFATCCSATNPTSVNAATGHFRHGWDTTHPASGTSGTDDTPIGANVEVEPLGGVELKFENVTSPGTTQAVLRTSVPELPAGLQVGDPPAFYEITTDATFEGDVRVCLPYGAVPEGTEPILLHFEDGAWVPAGDQTFTVVPAVVCGDVSSLSPFAAVFRPLSATEKIGEAVSALESLTTTRNADKLEDVVEKLDKALGKLAVSPPDRQGAVGELEGAVGDVQSAVRSRLLTSADGNAVMTTIAEAARLLAEEAIADAQGGDSAKLTEAGDALAAGDARLASGRFKDAVAKYKDAVSKAEGA